MNSELGMCAATPATKPGKRRQVIGAVFIVLGITAQAVALHVLLDQPQDFQRFMAALAIPLALLLVGGGILLWGIIDGIRALRQ